MLKAVEKKLKQVDPTFKTAADFNNYTPEEEAAANADKIKAENEAKWST